MNHCYIPEGYAPMLNPYETQLAISTTTRLFADSLCAQLNLRRVSAPPVPGGQHRPERRPERRGAARLL